MQKAVNVWVRFCWAIGLWLAFCGVGCNSAKEKLGNSKADTLAFLNHGANAQYVGSSQCQSCHQEIYKDWKSSSKGLSFGEADIPNGPNFNAPFKPIHDEEKGLTYQLIKAKSANRYSVLERFSPIDAGLSVPLGYAIGSGRQTRSYLFEVNGYFYEHPITYYSKKAKWDLSPGFEMGQNSRFDRAIGVECIQCHNDGTQKLDPLSTNRFLKIGGAIGCESCHGPGSLHISKQKEELSKKGRDNSIVNPKHLPIELQTDVCRNCHLEGVTVSRKKEPFLPGKKLSEHTAVFIPIKGNNTNAFGFASHAERLQLSKCFTLSNGGLTCTNCHNPHKKTESSLLTYNASCQNCHNEKAGHKTCKNPNHTLLAAEKGCVSCHMYQGPSTDIPHTSSRDHYIRVLFNNKQGEQADGPVTDLKDFTQSNNKDREYSLALMKWFESFDAQPKWLQKAEKGLNALNPEEQMLWYFFSGKPLPEFLQNLSVQQLSTGLNKIRYARMLIGIGKSGDFWYRNAVNGHPHDLNLRLLKGDYHLQSMQADSAIKEYEALLQLQPKHWQALGHLAAALIQNKQFVRAQELAQKSIRLNPLYRQGWEYYKIALAQNGQLLKAASVKIPAKAY